MVRHSYSHPIEIKWFFKIIDHPVDICRKIMWVCNEKIDIYVFHVLNSGYFSFSIPVFPSWPFHNSPIVEKLEVLGPHYGGIYHGQGRQCLPFNNKKRFCVGWVLKYSLGLLMGLRIWYWACGCFSYRRALIAVHFPWILQIESLPQGTSSFS